MSSTNPDSLTQLRDQWCSLPMAAKDEARLWKKFTLEWNYHSNHIEGNTLSYGETELLLVHGTVNGTHPVRDIEEMKAHDVAIGHLRGLADDKVRQMTEADVRDLNRILLKEAFWKEAITAGGQPTRIEIKPGEYKEQPNNVRLPDGSTFEYTAPADVPIKMAELMEWLAEQSTSDHHPLETATHLHHRFVLIHPFGDGNGRTARLLSNYVLLRAGYPPIIIRTDDKEEYLACLRQADAGDLDPLAEFFARNLGWSLNIAIKAAEGESIEDKDDLDKEIAIFKRNQRQARKKMPLAAADLQLVFEKSLEPMLREFVSEMASFDDFFSSSHWVIKTRAWDCKADDPVKLFLETVSDAKFRGGEINIMKPFLVLNSSCDPEGPSTSTELRITFGETGISVTSLVAEKEGSTSASFAYDEELSPSAYRQIIRDAKRALFEQVQEMSDASR